MTTIEEIASVSAVVTTEGERVVTVGRYGQKVTKFDPIWIVKTYVAKKNSKGLLQWVLVDHIGRSRAGSKPSGKLIREAQEYAESQGLRFVPNVVQFQVCE